MSQWNPDGNDAWDDSVVDDDELESETDICPECGADVYEDAERCPACGSYIIHTSTGYVWSNRPAWWVGLGLLGVLAVILTLVFAF